MGQNQDAVDKRKEELEFEKADQQPVLYYFQRENDGKWYREITYKSGRVVREECSK
tara:strand:- start:2481 stop:2648 length:168 start_codon:yes stop_codon:yes gene_type:complete